MSLGLATALAGGLLWLPAGATADDSEPTLARSNAAAFASDCPGAGGAPLVMQVPGQYATIAAAVRAAESNNSTKDVRIEVAAGDHSATDPIDISWEHRCNRRLSITGPTEGEARVLGGVAVAHTALTKTDPAYAKISPAARSKVRVAKVPETNLGLTGALATVEGEPAEFLKISEATAKANAPVEAFFGGVPLWPSQWPNRIESPPEFTTNYKWTRTASAGKKYSRDVSSKRSATRSLSGNNAETAVRRSKKDKRGRVHKLRARYNTETQVRVTWKKPKKIRSSKIKKYQLRRTVDGGTKWQKWRGHKTKWLKVGNRKYAKTYKNILESSLIQVRAVSNKGKEKRATVAVTAPSKPSPNQPPAPEPSPNQPPAPEPPPSDNTAAKTKTLRFSTLDAAPFDSWTDWDDVYAQGFWEVDWIEAYLPVTRGADSTLDVTFPKNGEDGVMRRIEQGSRFAVLNSLNGLDAAGEYVLKRNPLADASRKPSASSDGRVYFIPSAGDAQAELLLSTGGSTIFTLDSARGVSISGLTISAARQSAIALADSADIELRDLIFSNTGRNAIEASEAQRTYVTKSSFQHLGCRAISIDGGNRATLTPSGNVLADNSVSESPRRSLHYCEAFELSGVGQTMSNNLIHTSPSAVVELTGNDHVIEKNRIHHVALDSFDTGAIHWAAYSPASWGFKFNQNVIAYVGYKSQACSASTSCFLTGIYADDGSYGFDATENLIYIPDIDRPIPAGHDPDWYSEQIDTVGVFVNGGSRNNIGRNTVVGADYLYSTTGGFLEEYGTGAEPPMADDSDFWDDMHELRWNRPPFSTAYPQLATMLDTVDIETCNTDPRCTVAPFGETVADNVGLDIASQLGYALPEVGGGRDYSQPFPAVHFAGLETNLFCGGDVVPSKTLGNTNCTAAEGEEKLAAALATIEEMLATSARTR
jgi:hypothetical protein